MSVAGVCAGSASKFCPPSVGLYSRSASYHKDLGPLGADQVGHSWLWGVTGEQEWTIEMKTGESSKFIVQTRIEPFVCKMDCLFILEFEGGML